VSLAKWLHPRCTALHIEEPDYLVHETVRQLPGGRSLVECDAVSVRELFLKLGNTEVPSDSGSSSLLTPSDPEYEGTTIFLSVYPSDTSKETSCANPTYWNKCWPLVLEPGCSLLLCSEQKAARASPKPDESNPRHNVPFFFKVFELLPPSVLCTSPTACFFHFSARDSGHETQRPLERTYSAIK
jgi:hypothetical protein